MKIILYSLKIKHLLSRVKNYLQVHTVNGTYNMLTVSPAMTLNYI